MTGNARAVGVALVALGLALVPGLAAATATDTAPTTNVQQQSQQCDYEQLYNETIDSVVAVRTGSGLGTGFVYNESDNQSVIVTNEHVVSESSEVLITFERGETAAGTVVGTDPLSDLAAIRVDETPGYAEPLNLSEETPTPGQPVAALGSPFGLQSTVTSGIVSGTNRSIPTQFGYAVPNTIQTDAPINPGNSGGPLVACTSGDVLGVNRAGGGEDIGFAVPASIVERVVPSLLENGTYRHAFLGIQTAEVNEPVATANDLNTTEGVLVVRTVEGGPAENTLRESTRFASVSGVPIPVGGDVIVAIGNRSVSSPQDIARYLALEASPGETVEVTVLRDGERRTVNTTVVERPQSSNV
jgi:S1-C subfamily serine protease